MPKSPKFNPAGTFVGDDITLAAVSGGAATGSTAVFLSADYHTLRLTVSGVSFTGGTTPTVTPTVQTSSDGSVWQNLTPVSSTGAGTAAAPFGALSAAGTAHATFVGLDRYSRVGWTTTGAPTTTSFTVSGEAV